MITPPHIPDLLITVLYGTPIDFQKTLASRISQLAEYCDEHKLELDTKLLVELIDKFNDFYDNAVEKNSLTRVG